MFFKIVNPEEWQCVQGLPKQPTIAACGWREPHVVGRGKRHAHATHVVQQTGSIFDFLLWRHRWFSSYDTIFFLTSMSTSTPTHPSTSMSTTTITDQTMLTAGDVSDFARDLQCVMEGQPRQAYAHLVRELLLQRCRVDTRQRTMGVVRCVESIVRHVMSVIFAFQSPIVAVVPAARALRTLAQATRDMLTTSIGGAGLVDDTIVAIFNDKGVEGDAWTYIDRLRQEHQFLLSLCDNSPLVASVIALTLSDCGRRSGVTLAKGTRPGPKRRVLMTPPLDPYDEASSWLFNTENRDHWWVELKAKDGSTHIVDATNIEYSSCQLVFVRTSPEVVAEYAAESTQVCTTETCPALLDMVAQQFEHLNFDAMASWHVDL